MDNNYDSATTIAFGLFRLQKKVRIFLLDLQSCQNQLCYHVQNGKSERSSRATISSCLFLLLPRIVANAMARTLNGYTVLCSLL